MFPQVVEFMVEGNEIAFDVATSFVLTILQSKMYFAGGMAGLQEFYDNIEVTIVDDDSKGTIQ